MLAEYFDGGTSYARYVVDEYDLTGLKKVLRVAIEHHRNDELLPILQGASLLLDCMFPGYSVDTWVGVTLPLEQALGIIDKPEHYIAIHEGAYDE